MQNWKRSQGKSNNETVQTQPGSSGNISNRNLYRGRTDNKLPEFREASGSRGPRLKVIYSDNLSLFLHDL